MNRITKEERKRKLRQRTQRGVNERELKSGGRGSVLDLSKAKGKVIQYKMEAEKGKKRIIDIIPFIISQSWYKDLRAKSGNPTEVEPGYLDYKLEVPVHRNVGTDNKTFVCRQLAFGKKCPLCEELYAEWDKEESKQSEKKIDALKSSWRNFYNVYDYDGQSREIELWEDQSYELFEKYLLEAMDSNDEGLITFSDLDDGRTIEYKTREKKLGRNIFHETHSISFLKRDKYEEDILEKTHPLDAMLIIPSYEEVAKAHLGLDNDETQQPETSEPEAEQPVRRKPRQIDRSEPEEGKQDTDDSFPECPAGGNFGTDCNQLKDCEKCDEDLFKACTKAFEAGQTERRTRPAQDEKAEDKAPPVRRRRNI